MLGVSLLALSMWCFVCLFSCHGLLSPSRFWNIFYIFSLGFLFSCAHNLEIFFLRCCKDSVLFCFFPIPISFKTHLWPRLDGFLPLSLSPGIQSTTCLDLLLSLFIPSSETLISRTISAWFCISISSLMNSVFKSWIYFLLSFSCLHSLQIGWGGEEVAFLRFFEYMGDCSFEFFVYDFI